jgi:hypothetical protein
MDADAAKMPIPDGIEPASKAPLKPIARRRGPGPLVPKRETIDQYTDLELGQLAEWIASDGLLRTDEEFIRDIFESLPFKRLGPKIRERLRTVAQGGRRT